MAAIFGKKMIYFIQVKHNGPIKISRSNPWQHSGVQGVGMEVSALVDQFKDEGLVVDNAEMSIEQLPDRHERDTENILLLVFR